MKPKKQYQQAGTPAYQPAAAYSEHYRGDSLSPPVQMATLNDYPEEYTSYPKYLMDAEEKAKDVSSRSFVMGDTVLEFESKEAAKAAKHILPPALMLYNKLSTVDSMLSKIKGGDEKKKKLSAAKAGLANGLLVLQKGKKEAKKELKEVLKEKAEQKIDDTKKSFNENKSKASYGLELVKGCVDHITGSTGKIYEVLDFVSLHTNSGYSSPIKMMNQAKDQISEFKDSDLMSGMGKFSGFLGNAISVIKLLDPQVSEADKKDEMTNISKLMFEAGGMKGTAATLGYLSNLGKFYNHDELKEDEKADLYASTAISSIELAGTLSEVGVSAMSNTAKTVGVETSVIADITMGGNAAMMISRWASPVALSASIAWESVKWILGEVAAMNKSIFVYELQQDLKPILEDGNNIIEISKEISKLSKLMSANKDNEMLVDGFKGLIASQMKILKKHLMKILTASVNSKGLKRELSFIKTFKGAVKSLNGFNSEKNVADLRYFSENVLAKLASLMNKNKLEEMAGFDFRKDKQKEREKDEKNSPYAKDQAMFEKYGTLDAKKAAERKEMLGNIDTVNTSNSATLSKMELLYSQAAGGSYVYDVDYMLLDKTKVYQQGSEGYEILKKHEQQKHLNSNPGALEKYKKKIEEHKEIMSNEKLRYFAYLATIRSKKEINLLPEKDKIYVEFLIENPLELELLKQQVGISSSMSENW